MTLDDYILSHITPEDDYLYRLYRATNLHLLRPRMASGHLQGQLLRMITEERCLYTFEINDEQEDFTRPWLENAPYAPRIEMIVGDVFELLPAMNLHFDMVFIDANKRQYADYYELVMRFLNPGGYILADNTLWDGHVVEPEYENDAQTQGIRRFNRLVAADPRVENVILPLRDGLTVIRHKGI